MTSGTERIAVLGAGTMGAGIAQVAALAGSEVWLVDLEERFLVRARSQIEASLAKAQSAGKVTSEDAASALARVTFASALADAVPQAEIVIEAVPEDLALKQELWRTAASLASPHALLASNTSSLPIAALAQVVPNPERFLGLHFFNPVPVMKLLEMVRGPETSDAAIAAGRSLGERCRKTVIEVKDSPGFATSRLGVLIGLEAIRMLESGVATAADIDTAMTLGYGHPMGPLRLTDLVGLDVRLGIARHLHLALRSEAFHPPRLLEEMVQQGRLGQKAGAGFYDWPA